MYKMSDLTLLDRERVFRKLGILTINVHEKKKETQDPKNPCIE